MNYYNIIRLRYRLIYLSEIIADDIVTFCLGLMSNQEPDYTKWEIGTSKMLIDFKEQPGKCWECKSEREAKDTKKYFIDNKKMTDADKGKINGKFIYVKRMNNENKSQD